MASAKPRNGWQMNSVATGQTQFMPPINGHMDDLDDTQDEVVVVNQDDAPIDVRPWTKKMLKEGLQGEIKEDEEDMDSSLDWGQLVLILAVAFTFSAVLLCNILSKFSFLTLVYELNLARNAPDALTDGTRASSAFTMLVIIIMAPQFMTLLLCVWQSLYAARDNNPYPARSSWKWNFLQAGLEVFGLCTFVLVVATRLEGAFVLSILPAVFPAVGISRLLGIVKGRRYEDSPNRRYRGDKHHHNEAELEHMVEYATSDVKTVRHLTHVELGLYMFAAVVQVLGVLALPVYLYETGTPLWLSATTSASCIALSVAWLSPLHKHLRKPYHTTEMPQRAQYLPSLPKTARVWAYLINSVFKIILTIIYVVVYLHLDTGFSYTGVSAAFRSISHSDVLVAFLVQIFSSFIGYQCARLACLLTIQRVAFAFPLFISTPLALILFFTWNHFPFFSLPTSSVNYIYALIIFNLIYWASEVVLQARAAWNKKTPRLALDEALFIQPAYNGVFLEQFTLANRRQPIIFQGEDVREEMRSPQEELDRSIIFICTTMYREEEEEMRQVLKSLIGLSPELGHVCEAHTFMDGGANGDVLQQFALQLVHCFVDELERFYEDKPGYDVEACIAAGKRIVTPYGIRLEWVLPGQHGMPFIVHLKDGGKVKNKKRWSQILYMYYFLQFRFPPKTQAGTKEVAYILATDADVRFHPKDVKALHSMLSRDSRVGAVCGRTFPIGSGPLVWYQMFDYAIGHWFQKAAEHVLGSVLCCPGCFSLYRLDALRSTLSTYGTGVDKAFDFLIKDMGEDRWLCTLLVQEGWRLDYTATAFDYTHCPTGFKEFFNQRRRWIMSTLANIISLLKNWKKATRNNNSISTLFIGYQGLMLFSTVISPATVLLVIIGGMHYATDLSVSVLSGILVSLSGLFIIICMGGVSQDNQIFAAKIFTLLFAFVMGAVFIGVASQIAHEARSEPGDDTLTSPFHDTPTTVMANLSTFVDHVSNNLQEALGSTEIIPNTAISVSTVYLACMAAMFIFAGFLHLPEFDNLFHGIWYLLCLPGGYLFLIIYSFCNLNDRSWGTREEAAKKAEKSGGGWDEFMTGCGRYPKESFLKFLGRALCCRAGQPPPSEPPPVNPYSLITGPTKKDIALAWHIEYLSDHRIRAVCDPAEALLTMLRNLRTPLSDNDLKTVTTATAAAVNACPEIVSSGNFRQWDMTTKCFRISAGMDVHMLPFKDDMIEAIVTVTGSRTWEVSARLMHRDDLSKPLDQFLDQLHIRSEHIRRVLDENGYDDDTFFSGMKEDDLRAMGFHDLIDGLALVRKFLDASTPGKLKLQRPVVPVSIPTTMRDWLEYLHLECYRNNLLALGYGDGDLVLLEHVTDTETKAIGITKRAHVKKFQAGIKKLKDLLFQGRQPEGPSKETCEQRMTRDKVRQMQMCGLEESHLATRNVRTDEEAFWVQLVDVLLDYKLDPIENVANLKTDLENLRNTAVMSLIVINALWMVLMLVFLSAAASSLELLGTNPLGLSFLLLFGFLFLLQFLSMLWHRMSALVEFIAGVDAPWKMLQFGTKKVGVHLNYYDDAHSRASSPYE